MKNFKETLEAATIECEGGLEYVIAEDGIQDNFYFRYDFKKEEVGMCSDHQLTEDQKQILIDRMAEEIQEDFEPVEMFPNYDKEFGINNEMFI